MVRVEAEGAGADGILLVQQLLHLNTRRYRKRYILSRCGSPLGAELGGGQAGGGLVSEALKLVDLQEENSVRCNGYGWDGRRVWWVWAGY